MSSSVKLMNVSVSPTWKIFAATPKSVPSKVRLDSTVASSESLKVRTPLAVDPSKDIPPPPPEEAIVTASPVQVVIVTLEPAIR